MIPFLRAFASFILAASLNAATPGCVIAAPVVTYDLQVNPATGTTSTVFQAVVLWNIQSAEQCATAPRAELDWGDGTLEHPPALPAPSGNLVFVHTYSTPGNYIAAGRVVCLGDEPFIVRGVSVG